MEKKVGIVVTVHWSEEIRPNGDFLLKRFLDSLYQYCTHNFCIYIIDNESQFNLNVPNEKTKYIRIENQNSTTVNQIDGSPDTENPGKIISCTISIL